MSGYVYAFSNDCMPGIMKIGMTTRTLEERLQESNKSDTWRPPTPYKIEFAKKVIDPAQKEKTIHRILSINKRRINSGKEFFNISVDEVREIFNLMDDISDGKLFNIGFNNLISECDKCISKLDKITEYNISVKSDVDKKYKDIKTDVELIKNKTIKYVKEEEEVTDYKKFINDNKEIINGYMNEIIPLLNDLSREKRIMRLRKIANEAEEIMKNMFVDCTSTVTEDKKEAFIEYK